MAGWLGGWVAWLLDGWVARRMGGWPGAWVGGRADGWAGGWVGGTAVWRGGWRAARVGGWVGWLGGWADGCVGGWLGQFKSGPAALYFCHRNKICYRCVVETCRNPDARFFVGYSAHSGEQKNIIMIFGFGVLRPAPQ